MSYEMTGTVKQVNDVMTFSSGFTKREFVVTTPEQYPQDVIFETVKDKTSLLDSLSPGQEVTVHFDIRGREYNGRHFVNLNAWRIQTDGQSGAAPAAAREEIPPLDTDLPDSSDETDFPF